MNDFSTLSRVNNESRSEIESTNERIETIVFPRGVQDAKELSALQIQFSNPDTCIIVPAVAQWLSAVLKPKGREIETMRMGKFPFLNLRLVLV